MKMKIVYLLTALFIAIQANAHVNLVYPIGGETFVAGETVDIQWEVVISHNTENWDLFYSADGGNTWIPIELDISEEILNHYWVVPDNSTSQGQIRIVMDNVGTDYDDISDNFTIENVTGVNEIKIESGLIIYPNPITDKAVIAFDNPNSEKHRLTLYNSEGKMLQEMIDVTADRIIFRRDGLTSGLYFFQLKSKNEIRAIGKLMIE